MRSEGLSYRFSVVGKPNTPLKKKKLLDIRCEFVPKSKANNLGVSGNETQM